VYLRGSTGVTLLGVFLGGTTSLLGLFLGGATSLLGGCTLGVGLIIIGVLGQYQLSQYLYWYGEK
jgi:hypothetical protein